MGNRMGEAHGRAIRGPAESPELASSVERLCWLTLRDCPSFKVFFCNTLHKVVFVVKTTLRVPREGGPRGHPDSGAAPAGTARRASGRVDAPWEDGLSLPSAREPLSYEEVRHELTP